jgi:phosphatidylglycerol:prolipoprotein diacylglycerol transferase
MHPVLLTLPLPHWSIPLSPALVVVAIAGAAVALFAWRARAIDLLLIGVSVAVGGAGGAVAMRGEIYTLSELPLSSYGVTLCLALVIGWYLTVGLARRDGLPRDAVANSFIVAAVVGFVCSRLLYVAVNLSEFSSVADVVNVRQGGLSAYGGFLGGAIGSAVFLRLRRLPFLPWADVAVPSVALGVFIARIGSYLLGSGFGTPLGDGAPAWLKRMGTFPHWPEETLEGAGAPAWAQHVTDGLVPFEAEASLPVHPAQLYESLAGLLLVGGLLLVRRAQRFRGQPFLTFVFAYALARFIVETFRGDPQRGLLGPHIPEHQLLALTLAMFAAAFGFGPARSIASLRLRRVFQALAWVPPVVVFFVLRPEQFAAADPIQLSASQWLGLLSAVAAALVWGPLARAAEENPAAAMRIDLPLPEESSEEERESEPEAPRDDDEAGSDSHPPRREQRKRRRGGRVSDRRSPSTREVDEAAKEPGDELESGETESPEDSEDEPPSKP